MCVYTGSRSYYAGVKEDEPVGSLAGARERGQVDRRKGNRVRGSEKENSLFTTRYAEELLRMGW